MKNNFKKHLTTAICVVTFSLTAHADGWFVLVNSPTTLVLESDPLTLVTTPVPVDGGKIEFLYASLGTTNPLLFKPASGYGPVNIEPLAGRFVGGTFRLFDIEPAETVSALIRGWTGNFSSWDEAVASGVAKLGVSEIFQVATSDPSLTPPPVPPSMILNAVPGHEFTGLILQIPEPSSLALAGLGAAALGFFRRRK